MTDYEIYTLGKIDSDTLLIQMVDDHDLALIGKETACIRELVENQDFCLKAVKVNSWNKDLSPWEAPAVFGKKAFGDGTALTLEYLLKEVIPNPDHGRKETGRSIYLGGYSLAWLMKYDHQTE